MKRRTCTTLAAMIASALFGTPSSPVSAALVPAEHVGDGSLIYEVDTTNVFIGGIPIPIPVPREVEDSYRIVGINEAGDVLLYGQLKDIQFNKADLNYTMFSTAGQHDGTPEIIEHDKTGSRVDGLPTYLSGVARFMLPDEDGYIIASRIDRSPGPGNYADTLRIERHTGLSGASPSFTAVGYFEDSPSWDRFGASFPFTLPGGEDLFTADLESTNRTGDRFVFNARGDDNGTRFSVAYEVDGTGSDATVRAVRSGDVVTVDGQTRELNLVYSVLNHHGRSFGLVASYQGGVGTVLLGRNRATGEYYELSGSHTIDSLRYDTTAEGVVAYGRTGSGLSVADTRTGSITTLEGIAVTNTTGSTFASLEQQSNRFDNRPVFDANGDLLALGYVVDGPTNTPALDATDEGLFRFDVSTGAMSLILSTDTNVGNTGFALRGERSLNSVILSFSPHASGLTALVTNVRNGDESVIGDALLVLNQDGELIPVIMPGDQLMMADGGLLTVANVGALTTTLGDVNQKINSSGLAVLNIEGTDGFWHTYTVQLPIPEPASLALLAVGGVGLLARRRWVGGSMRQTFIRPGKPQ